MIEKDIKEGAVLTEVFLSIDRLLIALAPKKSSLGTGYWLYPAFNRRT
jgi:hypothetical protein